LIGNLADLNNPLH